MNQLVQGKIAANDDTLRGYFPNYDSFPADAQLGLHSMAWALGPHFPETWKNFTNALNGAASTTGTQGPPDYATAAVQSHISNATDARNAANMQMFQNAHTVAEQNLNYDTVFYPGEALRPLRQRVRPRRIQDKTRQAGHPTCSIKSSRQRACPPEASSRVEERRRTSRTTTTRH
jgi:hypothetical protein